MYSQECWTWACVTLQCHKFHERSGDVSPCRVSSPLTAHQDRPDSQVLELKATAGDHAPDARASRRALVHSPSLKGSSSLDETIPRTHSVLADSDGDVTVSAGTDTHSVQGVTQSAGAVRHSGKAVTQSARGVTRSAGAVTQSAGAITQSGEGVTNDSSQACSSVQLAQGGGTTAMAQLAEAAAAMCSEEKALQAQQAGQLSLISCAYTFAQTGNAPGSPSEKKLE